MLKYLFKINENCLNVNVVILIGDKLTSSAFLNNTFYLWVLFSTLKATLQKNIALQVKQLFIL